MLKKPETTILLILALLMSSTLICCNMASAQEREEPEPEFPQDPRPIDRVAPEIVEISVYAVNENGRNSSFDIKNDALKPGHRIEITVRVRDLGPRESGYTPEQSATGVDKVWFRWKGIGPGEWIWKIMAPVSGKSDLYQYESQQFEEGEYEVQVTARDKGQYRPNYADLWSKAQKMTVKYTSSGNGAGGGSEGDEPDPTSDGAEWDDGIYDDGTYYYVVARDSDLKRSDITDDSVDALDNAVSLSNQINRERDPAKKKELENQRGKIYRAVWFFWAKSDGSYVGYRLGADLLKLHGWTDWFVLYPRYNLKSWGDHYSYNGQYASTAHGGG